MTAWWRLVAAEDYVDPKHVETLLKRAIRKSRDYTAAGGSREDALYYSGQAHGYLGRLYVIEGKFLKAYRAVQRSRSYLLTCLKENPDRHDAYLGLGIYHYYADALPKYLKLVGWVFGLRGDRARGLSELRKAARNGEVVRGEAAYFLMNIMVNFEGNPKVGLDLGRWLVQAYPGNHVFFIEHLNVLESLGYYTEAERNMREAYAPGGRFEGCRSLTLMLGRNLYRQARYQEGVELLEAEIPEDMNKKDPIEPWLHYFAGRCRDLMGQRKLAERHYKLAEKAKAGGNVPQLAKDRRKNREDDALRRLRIARGIGRQPGRGSEAVLLWEQLADDLESGRLKSDLAAEVVRYRQGLSLESLGRFDEAGRVFASIGGDELGSRAAISAIRCLWRNDRTVETMAALDSLASISDFKGRHKASRLLRMIANADCGGATSAPETVAAVPVVFRDEEAWRVDLILHDGEADTRCLPMRFEDGAWHVNLPVVGEGSRYYYRVDGTRRRPDPLSTWELGERGLVWSLAGTDHSNVERPEWSSLSSH